MASYDCDNLLISDKSGSATKYQNGPGIDNKLSVKNGSSFSYFVTDHLGSTTSLINQVGITTSSAGYDSFGNQTGTLATRYSYTGRERDDFTGLMYYRARMYDPVLGRFISEDPIGFAGGDVNLYGYVRNNPLNRIDPLGLYDGPVNALRNPFAPEHWILNGSANTISDLLDLDSVAQWAWTIGDYRCSNEYRFAAGAKLIGWTAFQAFGGPVMGRGLGVIGTSLKSTVGRSGLSNLQLVQKAARIAENNVGGVGRYAGTEKHRYAKELVDRYQSIYGNRGLITESSWLSGAGVRYGSKGSVRIDVLDAANGVAYDYKFYARPPGLTPNQIRRTLDNGPSNLTQVLEVNP